MTALPQRSFAGGELSPAMYARTDLAKYGFGARTMRNGFVKKSGGWTNRAGSKYVMDAASNTYTKLVPWLSNVAGEAYMLEFSLVDGSLDPNDYRITFMQNGAPYRLAATPAAWSGAATYNQGDLVSRLGFNYWAVVDGLTGAGTDPNTPGNESLWHRLDGDIFSIRNFIAETPAELEALYYRQDVTTMSFVEGAGLPTDLIRNSAYSWNLRAWPFFPRYGIPITQAPTGLANNGAPPTPALDGWKVTTIGANFEESLPTAETLSGTLATPGTPITLTWTAVAGAYGYNVYKNVFGTYKFVFFVTANTFIDTGFTPAVDAETPPEPRDNFNFGTFNFPSVISSFQERTFLGNFPDDRQSWFLGKTGYPQNFTRKFPTVDDDSIGRSIKGQNPSPVRHAIDLGFLVIFTDTGEWIIKGNASNVLTPTSAQPEQYSYNGASRRVRPIVIGSDAIYVQEQGSIVRALGFDSIGGGRDGFRDADLTAFAEHMVEGRTIVAWAFTKTPQPIVWLVRDDGKMIALSYIREQQILAWHRHDTDGLIKDVGVIAEGGQHRLYLTVDRTINGSVARYQERMDIREFADIKDAVFMDCALTFDGRNTSGTTMTVTGGSAWNESETQTMTASAGFFVIGDVGNEIWLRSATGEEVRFKIEAYTSATVVTVRPDGDVPVNLQGVARTTWDKAVDDLSGLGHLEGKAVSIFADGEVVASPNNEEYDPPLVVTAGGITMPECHAYGHVGLPYISDLETLDIDQSSGETIADRNKLITDILLHLEKTRGVFAGRKAPDDDSVDPLQNLTELKMRENEDYGEPPDLKTGVAEVTIEATWNSNGRIFMRQVDPLPVTILAAAPVGKIPFAGG